jgi:hypothetical protein
MKNQIKFFQTVPGVIVITLLILTIPLVAMQFTDQVDWSVSDFIIMGILIFTMVLAFVLITRQAINLMYKAAIAGTVGTTFLMIWANAAVGLIGSGPHAGNFMYAGVVAVVIVGTYLSRFTARGMELAMFGTAVSLVLIAVIQLLLNMDEYPASSVQEIIAVNGFFCFLYATSGLLFRFMALEQASGKSGN